MARRFGCEEPVMARILITDDQGSVRGFVRAILEDAGHIITEARNGREALLALSRPHDLVITDVMMPDMDGLELLRHIKASARNLPVLVITGGWANKGVDLLSVVKSLGADRALSKARLRTELLPAVSSLLPP
ncbi:MAG TPA: response regulator [Alphaproteobacteria bacterium]|nr:response regulator [Alphaproteobacteria bacterium]